MDLQEIRQKNPQYKDWSDERLTKAINKKKAAQNETKGFPGVGEDIIDSLKSFFPAVKQMVPELISGAGTAAKNVVQHPLRSALNVGAGVGEGAIGLLNAPGALSQYLAKKDIVSQKFADDTFHIPDLGVEKKLGIDQGDEGDQFLKMISSFLVPGRVAKGFGGGKAAYAGSAAALAGGENQDPVHAAILASLGNVLAKDAPKAASKFERVPPSEGGSGFRGFRRDWTQKYPSPLSNEQLMENLRASGETSTGLGRIINNPELMKYLENESRKYPESGSEEIMGQTGNQIKDIGLNLVNEIKGDTPIEHYGDEVLNALKESKKDATKEKESKYKVVNDLAEKHNVTTKRNNFINAAKEELETAKNDPHLSIFQNEGEMKKLEKIVNDSEGKEYSLKDNDFLIGKLGEERQSNFEKGNTSEARLYKKLHESLKKDREEAIEESDAPEELKNAHKEANDFYKNEYSHFEDEDIAKWLRKGGDTDLLINHFIRKGKFSDRSKLIRKLQDKLPDNKKHILGSAYLSNAIKDGDFSPHQLRSLYKGLGEKQREALFTPEQRTKLADFVKLTDMNPEPLSLMLNPKTGFRHPEQSSMMESVMPILMGVLGGNLANIPTGLAAGAIPYLASKAKPKLIVKPKVEKMTSPNFREEFIKRLIEKRGGNV